MSSPRETAVPAQAVEAAGRALCRIGWDVPAERAAHIGSIRVALAAAFPLLLAELRATEGDLGVAVQVAAERADEIKRLKAQLADAIDGWTDVEQGVSELCDQADDDTKPLIDAPCYGYVDTRRIRSALGVGAATGTKGEPADG